MQIIYITEITHLCTAHVRGVFCELSREGKQIPQAKENTGRNMDHWITIVRAEAGLSNKHNSVCNALKGIVSKLGCNMRYVHLGLFDLRK